MCWSFNGRWLEILIVARYARAIVKSLRIGEFTILAQDACIMKLAMFISQTLN